ncbi:hypothetical protein ACG04Q_10380 [Roseateles sp. DXS20W]|uniref:Integron gene cassette protein n=1 Tax=Pelomonas lactea TaxID=3299030 RepID=A0ABW7GJF5_9BURK
MLKAAASAVDTGHRFHAAVFLSEVRYDGDKLVLTLTCPDEVQQAVTTFTEVVGFRLLDEGNLLEFWPRCAADHGWLFEISENGWFAQESLRSGFLSSDAPGITEYFVVSTNDCLNVVAGARPTVEIHAV